jgi:hypothetical protein
MLGAGCAEMRQNLRGQELSFRGTYSCPKKGCGTSEMTRSTKTSMEGATTISSVNMKTRSAIMFTAAAPFDSLTAKVTDCKGNRVDVAKGDVKKPGKHSVGDARAKESWAVIIDSKKYGDLELATKGKCAAWMVEAQATWSDSATYSLRSGLRAE